MLCCMESIDCSGWIQHHTWDIPQSVWRVLCVCVCARACVFMCGRVCVHVWLYLYVCSYVSVCDCVCVCPPYASICAVHVWCTHLYSVLCHTLSTKLAWLSVVSLSSLSAICSVYATVHAKDKQYDLCLFERANNLWRSVLYRATGSSN